MRRQFITIRSLEISKDKKGRKKMGRVQDRKKDSVLEEVDENKDGPKPRNIIVKS